MAKFYKMLWLLLLFKINFNFLYENEYEKQ